MEVILPVMQGLVGLFFGISGAHKLVVPERQDTMQATMEELEIPFPTFNRWWVSSWEFLGGFGLLLVSGMYAVFLASILFVICAVATCTDGRQRVHKMRPLNPLDRFNCYLYLPETWIGLTLVMVITHNMPI